MDIKDKKVLLVGLGILGGGLSMAKYLLKKGSRLRITDLRKPNELKDMTARLPRDVKYTLGLHKKEDFEWADIIIFNQAVSYDSEWVTLAKKLKKEFYTDYTFFLKNFALKPLTPNPKPLMIGITGTRGKTTVATWTQQLIPDSVLAGNIPEKNFFKQMDKKTEVFVLELSSFQLEHMEQNTLCPNIAILTNVYVDHLNRYKTLGKYKEIKFNIFKNQTEKDALILNLDEGITREVLALKPKSQLFFISQKKLPAKRNGMYFKEDDIFFKNPAGTTKVATKKGLAPHEKTNLLFAMISAHLAGVEGSEIAQRIQKLASPKLRQELILKNNNYEIYNDSAGTSPDATIAAIEKFKDRKDFVLITGGTDKELEFKSLAKKITKEIKPENLFLLSGSGTEKLIHELTTILGSTVVAYESLDEIVDAVSQQFDKATVVFSPGAASFEKFKNEFDRGEKFTKLAKKYFK